MVFTVLAIGIFALGGLASFGLVSRVVERTGLHVVEDKVYDRRL